MKNKYKVVIPEDIIKIFENNESIIYLNIDGKNIYSKETLNINNKILELSSDEFENIVYENWLIPVKKEKEKENKKLLEVIEIVQKINVFFITIDTFENKKFFFEKDDENFLEHTKNAAVGIDSIESLINRIKHIDKHYKGIKSYKINENPDGDEYFPVFRYYIYNKNWMKTNSSSGSGNITSWLEKKPELKDNQEAIQVQTNFRMKKEYL